jgi:hypothetical protein
MSSRFVAVRSAMLALLLVASGAAPSLAEPPTPLQQRFQGAQRAVVGKVAVVQPRWDRNEWGDQLIVSRMTVEVEETLKGFSARRLEVDIEGGTLDGLTLHVSHQAELAPGDRAIFILNETTTGVHTPHRKGLGLMRLDGNNRVEGTFTTLADVRTAARSAAALR